MHTSNLLNRMVKHEEQQCSYCASNFPAAATHCHHCDKSANDDYAKFKQSLNQQQDRAMLVTRLVIGFSLSLALIFLVSI